MAWLTRRRQIALLFLILILAAVLRFYKIEELFIFGFDEEHQISLAIPIVKHFHIIWIGVSAANLDFYLGPFWVYFTSLWLFLSKGDPLITGYVASTIGILTTLAVFWVGYKLFNVRVGLLASLMYATLPLIVFSDRKYLTPTLVPLLSLVLLMSLYQIKHSGKWLIVFAAALGLVFHTHLSLLFYSLVGIYWSIKYKNRITKKIWIISLVVFIMIISPLIAFDYFHKWSNISVPLRLVKNINQGNFYSNFKQHSQTFFEALGRIWYLNPNTVITDEIPFDCKVIFLSNKKNKISERTQPNVLLSTASLILLIWFLFRSSTWREPRLKLLALSILSIVIPFLVFPGGSLEYYLLGFFPLFLFLATLVTTAEWKGKFIIIIMLVFSFLGIRTVLSVNDEYSFKNKKQLISDTMKIVKDAPFELSEAGLCHRYEGWRYLFSIYDRKPERSATDASLGWLYPDEISKKEARYSVIMSETKIPLDRDVKEAIRLTKGGFTSYIFKNL